MVRKIRIGVVGLGSRGRYFAQAYDQHPDSELIAVCDPNPAALATLRPGYGDRIAYESDPASFFAREDMDAVVIASADRAHRDNAVEAFRCGKHVLLEKPMAMNVAECDEILRAWDEAGTVLMVGLELRYCPLFVRMRELLDEGSIGDILTGMAIDNVSVGGNYFYHDRRRTRAYIGSLLTQKGVHTIDLLNWFMGGRPVSVFAHGSLAYFGGNADNDKRCRDCEERERCPFFIRPEKFVMDYGEAVEKEDFCVYAREADVNDNSQLLVRYDTGRSAVYTESHFTPEYTREFELVGDRGKMNAFYNNEGHFRIRNQYRFTDHIDEWHPPAVPGGHGGSDPRLQQAFLDWVRDPSKMRVDEVLAARDATCLGAAAETSIETGVPVAIPPPPALKRAANGE